MSQFEGYGVAYARPVSSQELATTLTVRDGGHGFQTCSDLTRLRTRSYQRIHGIPETARGQDSHGDITARETPDQAYTVACESSRAECFQQRHTLATVPTEKPETGTRAIRRNLGGRCYCLAMPFLPARVLKLYISTSSLPDLWQGRMCRSTDRVLN